MMDRDVFDKADETHVHALQSLLTERDPGDFLSGCEKLYERFSLPEAIGRNLALAGMSFADAKGWNAAGLFLEAYAHAPKVCAPIISQVSALANPFVVLDYIRTRSAPMRSELAIAKLKDALSGPDVSGVVLGVAQFEERLKRGAALLVAPAAIPQGELEHLARRLPVKCINVATPHRRIGANISSIAASSLRTKYKVDDIDRFSQTALYERAGELSNEFAQILGGYVEDAEVCEALRVIVRDRLVEGLQLVELIRDIRNASDLDIPAVFVDRSYAKLFTHCFGAESIYVSPSSAELFQAGACGTDVVSCLSLDPGKAVHYQPSEELRGRSGHLVVHGAIRDRNVWQNLRPLLQNLCQAQTVLLEPDALQESDYLGDFEQFHMIENLVTVCAESAAPHSHPHLLPIREPFEAAWAAYCFRQFENAATDPDAGGVLFAAICAAPAVRRLVTHFAELYRYWEPAVRSSTGVFVMHGRRPGAMALVGLAKKFGKPTYELQPAFISVSGNYVAPQVDTVFSYDPHSASVYRRLGVEPDRIREVGSPRIEAFLSGVSEMSETDARRIAFGRDSAHPKRYAVFAGQPLPDEVSDHLFAVSVGGVLSMGPDWHLVLRAHPRDDAVRLRRYAEIADRMGLPAECLLGGAGDAVELKAADAIITYYSLVGLEALALGKPVISVRPRHEIQPPFDLCDIGAIGAASSCEEVMALLAQAVGQDVAAGPDLKISRGNAVGTIHDIVQQTAGEV